MIGEGLGCAFFWHLGAQGVGSNTAEIRANRLINGPEVIRLYVVPLLPSFVQLYRVLYRMLYLTCGDWFLFPNQLLARAYSCAGRNLSSHQFSFVFSRKQRPSGAHFGSKASTRPDVHRCAVLRRTGEHLWGTVPSAAHVLGPSDEIYQAKLDGLLETSENFLGCWMVIEVSKVTRVYCKSSDDIFYKHHAHSRPPCGCVSRSRPHSERVGLGVALASLSSGSQIAQLQDGARVVTEAC